MMYLILLCLAIHLAFYFFLFNRLAYTKIKESDEKTSSEELSIVVCLKNELDRVPELINRLQNQEATEIILVDDFSTDGTLGALQEYESEKIKIIRASEDIPGKKKAQSEGIAAANTDRILVTDADCYPEKDWAATMNTRNSPIVLGYSPMKKTKGMVNLFSRFETYLTGIQYLSYAQSGIPYMGVGRNMITDRRLITENKEKIKGQQLASGDDDLTINAIANSENTQINLNPASFVYTDSVNSWKAFIRQKSRHISTSVYYRPLHQLLLGAFSFSQICLYILMSIGLVIGTIDWQIAIIVYTVKQSVQIAIHYRLLKMMQEYITVGQLLLLDLLLFLYYLIMPFILLIRKNSNHWS